MRARAAAAPVAHLVGPPSGLINVTIVLLLGVIATFAAGIVALRLKWLSPIALTPLNAVALYAAYTITHESAHGLTHRHRKINEWAGRIAAALQGISLPLYRVVHLRHHANVNDPEHDPDFVVSRRPQWLLPFWLVVRTLHDESWLAAHGGWGPRRRALYEHRNTRLLQLVVAVLAVLLGASRELVWGWLVPMLIAGVLVNFVVAWAVHSRVPCAHDIVASRNYGGWIVRALSLNQSLHLVHHLWTGIPWFRYGRALPACNQFTFIANHQVGDEVTHEAVSSQ